MTVYSSTCDSCTDDETESFVPLPDPMEWTRPFHSQDASFSYPTLQEATTYKGFFDEQPFLSSTMTKKDDHPILAEQKECDGMHPYWYTLGYREPPIPDAFTKTIQHNPHYYWYGGHLGETPIRTYPREMKWDSMDDPQQPYQGACRPNAVAIFH